MSHREDLGLEEGQGLAQKGQNSVHTLGFKQGPPSRLPKRSWILVTSRAAVGKLALLGGVVHGSLGEDTCSHPFPVVPQLDLSVNQREERRGPTDSQLPTYHMLQLCHP